MIRNITLNNNTLDKGQWINLGINHNISFKNTSNMIFSLENEDLNYYIYTTQDDKYFMEKLQNDDGILLINFMKYSQNTARSFHTEYQSLKMSHVAKDLSNSEIQQLQNMYAKMLTLSKASQS